MPRTSKEILAIAVVMTYGVTLALALLYRKYYLARILPYLHGIALVFLQTGAAHGWTEVPCGEKRERTPVPKRTQQEKNPVL